MNCRGKNSADVSEASRPVRGSSRIAQSKFMVGYFVLILNTNRVYRKSQGCF